MAKEDAIVGTARVSIMPTFKGFRKSTGKAANALGRQFGRRFSKSFDSRATDLGSVAVRRAQQNVAKATDAFQRARRRQEDASGRVRVAEAKLNEALKKYPKNSSQVISAEERLEKARRGEEDATRKLSAASAKLKAAQGEAARAADQHRGRLEQLRAKVGELEGKFGKLGGAFKRASSTIAGPARAMGEKIGQIIPQGVKDAAGRVSSAAGRMWEGVTAGAGRVAQSVSGAIGKAGPLLAPLGKGLGSFAGGVASVAGQAAGAVRRTFSDSFTAIKSAATGLAAAIGGILIGSTGQAVRRVDTLNNFPKVMQNLGYSAEDAARALEKVDKGTAGLPTRLDDIASNTQILAPLTGSLDDAADLAVAMNNALLAGGKGAGEASRAFEQYSQMLAVGKVDMQSWRSMAEVMPGQLNQIAQSLLGPTANSQQLYDAMSSGAVTFDEFNEALLDLNENGLDNFASFEQQAKDSTKGIGTAWSNLKTAFVKGTGEIIQGIGAERIADAINTVGGAVKDAGTKIGEFIANFDGIDGVSDLGETFKKLSPIVGLVGGIFGKVAGHLPILGRAFTGLTGPVGLVIGIFTAMWQNSEKLRDTVKAVWDKITDVFEGAESSIGPAMEQLGDLIADVAGVLGDLLADAINVAIPFISELVEVVWDVVEAILPHLMPALESTMNAFGAIIEAVWPLVEFLGGLVMPTIKILADVFKDAFNFIADVVRVSMDVVAGIISGVTSAISAVWRGGWTGIKDFARNVWEGIKNWVSSGIDRASSYISSGLDRIKRFWRDKWEHITSTAREKWNSLIDFFKRAPGEVRNAFTVIGRAITAPFRTAMSGIRSLWNSTLGKISFTVPSWVPKVGGKGWSFPKLAEGGVIAAPTMALIGEGREHEAVLPLSKLRGMLEEVKRADVPAGRPGQKIEQHFHITTQDPQTVARWISQKTRTAIGVI